MPQTTYPSFYRVVHEAYLGYILEGLALELPWCEGDPEHYEPEQHTCYQLAAELRVRLHAAGIRLSGDGNGAGGGPNLRQPVQVYGTAEPRT